MISSKEYADVHSISTIVQQSIMCISFHGTHVIVYECIAGNCGAVNAINNFQVLNSTDPDSVLLTCVDGFEPEEVILVQCINRIWHPDPATINCTEKSPPIRESGKKHLHNGQVCITLG